MRAQAQELSEEVLLLVSFHFFHLFYKGCHSYAIGQPSDQSGKSHSTGVS